jgi:VIT1/CCC1 family predicted Fe2+/Mn2+ transporter
MAAMAALIEETPARVLDPIQRVSEVIFGVLMAMTFIGAMNVATAGAQEVRTVMKTALGCNLAWGLADAVMYLISVITERTRDDLRPRLRLRDLKGALGVFLLVALSTFPLVLPFVVVRELGPALLASRLMALSILFLGGWLLARHAGGNRWLAGCSLAAVGAVLLSAIVALGG